MKASSIVEALEAQLVATQEDLRDTLIELSRWKTCASCGKSLDSPGICAEFRQEHQEVLARAEKAEAELAGVYALGELLQAALDRSGKGKARSRTVDKCGWDTAGGRV